MAFWDFFKKFQYVQQSQLGVPQWSVQKDEDFVREGYNQVVWVYACVSQISSAVSSVPWLLYRKGRGGKLVEVEEHPILTMLNVKANPYMSSRDFFDMWATYLAVEGKFYAEYVGQLPTQMFPIYPHYMKPIPDANTFVSGFEYQQGGKIVRYKAQDILWSKFNDILDIYQGLSPIRALARTIDTENEVVDWNKSTIQNGAVPPGIFSITNPGPELQNKLRDEWLKRYAGSGNAKIPLILNADKAQYQQLGFSVADMDFLNQRKINRTEICAAFGVPSQIVGIPDGQTYSNFGEAQKAFWENTIIPKYLEHIKDKLQYDMVSRYADNLVLKYDVSGVGALKENTDKISARALEQYKSNVITLNEARYALDMSEVQGGDLFAAQIQMELLMQQQSVQTTGSSSGQKSLDQEESKKKDILIEEWKKFEDKRVPFYTTTEKQVSKQFDKERELIVNAIKDSNMAEMNRVVDEVIGEQEVNWRKLLTATYIAVFEKFGNESYDQLKNVKMMTKAFDLFSNAIMAFISSTVAKKVVMVTDTTKNEIKQRIQFGIDQEYSIPQIAKLIDDLYLEKIIPNRSTVIARTEVISASNRASLEGAVQSGAKVTKYWIPTADSRTRESHLEMRSHPAIPLDQKFNVNGHLADNPADSNLPASECINCRCAIGYKRS